MPSEPRIDDPILLAFSTRDSGGRQDQWNELELRFLLTELRVELRAAYDQMQRMERLRALLFPPAADEPGR